MLEEILLFHSTYSKQLLLDATLIGSTDPIQPCRDGESQLCSSWDTRHWDSQTPLSRGSIHTHQPINGLCFGLRSLLLLGQWEGVSGRSLCRKGCTPVKMTPKFPRKIHWRAEVSRDSLSHHELWAPGGDGATKTAGAVPQVRRAPLGTCVLPAVCPSATALLPPSCCNGLRANLEPGKAEDRFGMCYGAPATHPYQRPAQGQGGALCLCTCVTHQTYQRSNVTTISMNKVGQSQPWGRQEPSRWL